MCVFGLNVMEVIEEYDVFGRIDFWIPCFFFEKCCSGKKKEYVSSVTG